MEQVEQAPTTSSANEMQSDMLAKDGYFDYVYSIFKAQQHPIVVVEEFALRWMGLRVFPEEVTITPLFSAALRFFDTYKRRIWTY